MLSLISSPSGMLKEAKSPEVTQKVQDPISVQTENCKGLERV